MGTYVLLEPAILKTMHISPNLESKIDLREFVTKMDALVPNMPAELPIEIAREIPNIRQMLNPSESGPILNEIIIKDSAYEFTYSGSHDSSSHTVKLAPKNGKGTTYEFSVEHLDVLHNTVEHTPLFIKASVDFGEGRYMSNFTRSFFWIEDTQLLFTETLALRFSFEEIPNFYFPSLQMLSSCYQVELTHIVPKKQDGIYIYTQDANTKSSPHYALKFGGYSDMNQDTPILENPDTPLFFLFADQDNQKNLVFYSPNKHAVSSDISSEELKNILTTLNPIITTSLKHFVTV